MPLPPLTSQPGHQQWDPRFKRDGPVIVSIFSSDRLADVRLHTEWRRPDGVAERLVLGSMDGRALIIDEYNQLKDFQLKDFPGEDDDGLASDHL